MTGETGSCFGRNDFLCRVVPEPESGRYADTKDGTLRNLLFLAGFLVVYVGVWTGSSS
jgi:hypothetical protein